MAKSKKESGSSLKAAAGVGIGLAAVAGAVAGTYFLYGTKEGARQRKQIKAWSIKMKGEVLEKIENVKEINEEVYGKIVDTVAEKYRKMKNVDAADVEKVRKELRGHWRHIARHAGKKGTRKAAKRTSRKKSASRKKRA